MNFIFKNNLCKAERKKAEIKISSAADPTATEPLLFLKENVSHAL